MSTMSGSLPEHVLERLGEAVRVGEDLALVHETAFVLVDELDRILDGDDVLLPLAVDLVDHRGERGRLAAARRPRHEDEAARELRHVDDRRRQAELMELRRLMGNRPERAADAALLVVHVAAETGDAADAEREVQLRSSSKRFFCPSVSRL
jgi:hypothetical protein